MDTETNVVTIKIGNIRPACFVIMPFAPAFQSTYDRVIKPAVQNASLVCVRGDEVFTRAQITHEIWRQIRACRFVIAELTGRNPNVLYSLGLAHALGKPAIIITRIEHDWNVHLVQDENILSGTIVISFRVKGTITVVQESISGTISKRDISWHGTSYSFLERGKNKDFLMNSFQGTVGEEGNEISGHVSDNYSKTALTLYRTTTVRSGDNHEKG